MEAVLQETKKETTFKAKPFLKWVGGKRQLLNIFRELYPQELKQNQIKNFYEPFVGGGAVFFDIAQNYHIENAYLYDINPELILTYRVIQKDVISLIEHLAELDYEYKKLDQKSRDSFFYNIREKFNQERNNINFDRYSKKWIPRASQIIFLNKTCFNGLFRFNLKGDFNSPVGRYKNPKILDEENLINVSKTLEIATIRKADFKYIKKEIKDNSFVYFDPPYRPISKTANFTSYSKDTFQDDEQIQLAKLFSELDGKGALLMLSNSDPKNINPEDHFFEEIYTKYHIIRVPAKRSINSDASKRSAINEIIVRNY